jgi:uncharacterized protein YlaN (UPF0358 family)
MAKTSMLGYVKEILFKVSFDLSLFEKELHKSIRLLLKEELPVLHTWCTYTFRKRPYWVIIERCFHLVA